MKRWDGAGLPGETFVERLAACLTGMILGGAMGLIVYLRY